MKTRSCDGIATKGLFQACVWKGNEVNVNVFMDKPPRHDHVLKQAGHIGQ